MKKIRRRHYRPRSPFRFKLKKQTMRTIAALGLIGVSALTILSFFSSNGGMAEELKNLLTHYFGWAAIFVPVITILAGILFTKLRLPLVNFNTFSGLSLLLLSFIGLGALVQKDQSGLLGTYESQTATLVFSRFGAYVLFFFTTVFGLIILFNTSLEDGLKIISNIFSSIGSVLSIFKKIRLLNVKTSLNPNDKLPFVTKGLRPNFGPEKKLTKEAEATPILATQLVTNLPMENKVWEYPPLDLLNDQVGPKANRGDIKQNAAIIEKTLESFGIQARVVEVNFGPAVTQYALEIALGTKLTKITALANDIALGLAAPTGAVRIEAPIPGKSLVGIEVPNITPETVSLKSLLSSAAMQKAKSKLAFGMGLDISGEPVVGDITKMPHALIAGATGSGKSIFINGIIASLLFRTTPSELKLILVDPKIVELSGYNGIPHLLTPVITEPEKVLSALKWATGEMERRYKLFAEVGSRNIEGYNEMSGFQALPYIVIIIDELADLMMFAPVEVEDSITRIAQMARATGIHLIVATQRPSVDVITGVIKANIPTRIAFNVSSLVDSRVIMDQSGAEKLLGKGDMLYVPPDVNKPNRIQGVFVNENELTKLLEFLKKSGAPTYTEEVTTQPLTKLSGKASGGRGQDEFFDEAVRVVCQYDRASASLLQRRLRVGYARAARLLDELEMAGVVGNADGSKARDVLVKDAEGFLNQSGTEG